MRKKDDVNRLPVFYDAIAGQWQLCGTSVLKSAFEEGMNDIKSIGTNWHWKCFGKEE